MVFFVLLKVLKTSTVTEDVGSNGIVTKLYVRFRVEPTKKELLTTA